MRSEADQDTDWQWFNEQSESVAGTVPVLIGTGATIPKSYAQSQAQKCFLDALYRLVPESTRMLVGAESRAIRERLFQAVRDAITADIGVESLDFPDGVADEIERFRVSWQERFHLNDEWLAVSAIGTMEYADRFWRHSGAEYVGRLREGWEKVRDPTVHDGLREPTPWDPTRMAFTWYPDHLQINRPVMLDDLRYPSVVTDEGEFDDDGDIGYFDPRSEKPEDAAKRILPALEQRLMSRLRSIEREDRDLNGAIDPVTFKTLAPFEWTVRYQVMGESRNRIAASVGRDRTHVGREIQRIADLIELTLRPERGGRPSKRG